MNRIATRLCFVVLLGLPLMGSGCGDSDSTAPGTTAQADFSGMWRIDGEVLARRVCDRPIGTLIDGASLGMAQHGSVVQLFYEFEGIELAVDGSKATGGGTLGPDQTVQFDLRIVDDQLTGSIDITDMTMPCTEHSEISGTRESDPPSPGFEGNWEFALTRNETNCEGESTGGIDYFCEPVIVEGNGVSILDEDEGVIIGYGDNNHARLLRKSGGYELRMDLDLSGDELTGQFTNTDLTRDCYVHGPLTASRRDRSCDDPGDVGDFSGTWAWTVEEISNGCGLPIGPDCSEFVQEGNIVTITSDGIQGTVSGNTLSAMMQETLEGTVSLTATWELELSLDGTSFTGTNSVRISDSEDPESDCETIVALAGTRTTECVPVSEDR